MLLLLALIAVVVKAQIWGTFKPNLYFSLKDVQDAAKPQHIALFWIVQDWRTGINLVRHRVHAEVTYEDVDYFYEEHDGHSKAQETIIDREYNV